MHVNKQPEGSSVLKVTAAEFLDSKKSRGRPKNSWNGCVSNDANVLEIRNWQKLCKDRASFRRTLNAAMGPRAP